MQVGTLGAENLKGSPKIVQKLETKEGDTTVTRLIVSIGEHYLLEVIHSQHFLLKYKSFLATEANTTPCCGKADTSHDVRDDLFGSSQYLDIDQ